MPARSGTRTAWGSPRLAHGGLLKPDPSSPSCNQTPQTPQARTRFSSRLSPPPFHQRHEGQQRSCCGKLSWRKPRGCLQGAQRGRETRAAGRTRQLTGPTHPQPIPCCPRATGLDGDRKVTNQITKTPLSVSEAETRTPPRRESGHGAGGAALFRSGANTLVCFFPSPRSQLLNS